MAEMRAFIAGLGDRGVTVLLSSHLMPEVEQVSDRVGVIRDGVLVAEGTVDELRGRARLRVLAHPADEAARIVAALPGVAGVDRATATRWTSRPTARRPPRSTPRSSGPGSRSPSSCRAGPRSRTSSSSSRAGVRRHEVEHRRRAARPAQARRDVDPARHLDAAGGVLRLRHPLRPGSGRRTRAASPTSCRRRSRARSRSASRSSAACSRSCSACSRWAATSGGTR